MFNYHSGLGIHTIQRITLFVAPKKIHPIKNLDIKITQVSKAQLLREEGIKLNIRKEYFDVDSEIICAMFKKESYGLNKISSCSL